MFIIHKDRIWLTFITKRWITVVIMWGIRLYHLSSQLSGFYHISVPETLICFFTYFCVAFLHSQGWDHCISSPGLARYGPSHLSDFCCSSRLSRKEAFLLPLIHSVSQTYPIMTTQALPSGLSFSSGADLQRKPDLGLSCVGPLVSQRQEGIPAIPTPPASDFSVNKVWQAVEIRRKKEIKYQLILRFREHWTQV